MTHCWGACTESSCGVNGQCPAPPVSATAVSTLVKSQKISDLMSILFCPELRVLQLPWERAGLRPRVPATLPRERIRWRPWIPCVGSLRVSMFEAAHVPTSTFGVAGSLALAQQLSVSPPVEFSIFIGGKLQASGSSECKPGCFRCRVR